MLDLLFFVSLSHKLFRTLSDTIKHQLTFFIISDTIERSWTHTISHSDSHFGQSRTTLTLTLDTLGYSRTPHFILSDTITIHFCRTLSDTTLHTFGHNHHTFVSDTFGHSRTLSVKYFILSDTIIIQHFFLCDYFRTCFRKVF